MAGMTVRQVADAAGISVETVRHYQKVATRRRAAGTATERELPAPHKAADGSNEWHPDEISEWVEIRKRPTRKGAIPKSEMAAVLTAAEANNLDRVIEIARRNLS